MRAEDPNLTPDPRDVVELSFAPPPPPPTLEPPDGEMTPGQRRGGFLRLWFRCAGQYGRAYKNREGTKYVGRCPTCGACVQFGIGQGGTSRRQFEVSCK